ncbi:anhydro-N-acetylmuramic acid kinase [Litoreibacter roseus]|uniref:Anhydro-N-acetylmuramic acid kinase n=1 Tax=Litoreibacter roseus TaxID=2601869 RepID=A0A6N6JIE0_9RHOB|nr:anhydro-N-acetylmuramic acid kinase [Litoreibacter roseus]GFE66036.1 anhydro-N-acetylmuramic acid kinase [Litoreibacter roseus]
MKGDGPIWALGTMSGTSLDGVDAAMILTDGVSIFEFGPTAYRPYSDAERAVLRSALGKWHDALIVPDAAEIIETAHAEVIFGFSGFEIVGFHGQTLAHEPGGRGTHQAGDGIFLAEQIGAPVAWDFRTADVGLGGQGAPLAPFYHFACAKYLGAKHPVAFLNMGGVGNITYVDPGFAAPEDRGALLAFDTGPANAPSNDLIQSRQGKSYDADGAIAAQGAPDQARVDQFMRDPYFSKVPPKSLDRNDFPYLADLVLGLSDADALATLLACSAAGVARAVEMLPKRPAEVLVTGGGRKNPVLMEAIQARVAARTVSIDERRLDGDMLEAQAFGYLAVRVARGLPTSAPSTTGVAASVGGGIVSQPKRKRA